MKFVYPMVVHDDPDGLWDEFPDVEGCFTQADSLNELMFNAVEALTCHLEGGYVIKPATDIRKLTLEPSTFAQLVAVDVDITKNTKSVKKTLTIPEWLNNEAVSKGINFSQTLQEALIAKIA